MTGNMSEGECCFVLGERVCQFITRKFSVAGDPWKLRATGEERESERSQISQKYFG